MEYLRPLARADRLRPPGALPLAGSRTLWFDRVEVLSRAAPARVVAAQTLSFEARRRLSAPRSDLCGRSLSRSLIMGIVNITPDSFSDGGRFLRPDDALAHARSLAEEGADLLDLGGESTRPGAQLVEAGAEIERTAPVIDGLRQSGIVLPLSIDTRKAKVARAAFAAGADMLNDVSALGFDPDMAELVAQTGVPVCLMHAQGSPETMQEAPHYTNVLLDVFDVLADRIAAAEAAGVSRAQIIVDPGIGFGKTVEHNLVLLQGIALFHDLGCPILLGASRKRFIGALSGADAQARVPGSLAVALHAAGQGVQILRLHDVAETRQALQVWQAIERGRELDKKPG